MYRTFQLNETCLKNLVKVIPYLKAKYARRLNSSGSCRNYIYGFEGDRKTPSIKYKDWQTVVPMRPLSRGNRRKEAVYWSFTHPSGQLKRKQRTELETQQKPRPCIPPPEHTSLRVKRPIIGCFCDDGDPLYSVHC